MRTKYNMLRHTNLHNVSSESVHPMSGISRFLKLTKFKLNTANVGLNAFHSGFSSNFYYCSISSAFFFYRIKVGCCIVNYPKMMELAPAPCCFFRVTWGWKLSFERLLASASAWTLPVVLIDWMSLIP